MKLRSYTPNTLAFTCLTLCLYGCGETTTSGKDSNIVTADASAGTLAAALTTAVHVRVTPVTFEQVQQLATVSGVVKAFRKATVASEISARVVSRLVEPGDKVSKGQVLLVLDDERARIASNETTARVRSRETDLAEARRELQRGKSLHNTQFISEDTLETLSFAVQRAESELAAATAAHASAERAVADTSIRAPFDGIAELVHVQEGDYLNPGMSVATIVDFSRARIRAGVTAREATLLAGTTTAELALEALGGDLISGKVHSVARIADAATGTFAVEIWLDNATHLREGMLATVYMPYQAREARPTVPTAAIFRRNGTPHVFTVADNRARLTAVRTGRSNGSVVEVLEGLSKGESVVIEGQFALRDGATVAIVGRDI